MRLTTVKIFFAVVITTGALSAAVAVEKGYYDYNPIKAPTEDFTAGKYIVPTALVDSTQVNSVIEGLMASQHVSGVSALVIKNGGVYWLNQYGMANIAENLPVADSTLFMLASVSKPFTGTALMQLWENEYFELDDNVNDYLPYTVQNPSQPGRAITFRMLMTHTSTIMDNWDILDPMPAPGDPTIQLEQFTQGYLTYGGMYYAVNNYYGAMPPGNVWSYTNVGVTLIAYLVEQITGMDFEDYCQENIFQPLGMDETSWFLANLDTNNIAMLYEYIGGEFVPYGHMGRPWWPAGQLRTSASQLARFLQAFMQGGIADSVRILEEATVDTMLTLQFTSIFDSQGLIWRRENIAGCWVWRHGGSSWGTRTVMSFCPEDGIGVIVLSNGESDLLRDQVESILYDFARSESGVKPIPPETIPADFGLTVYPNPFNSAAKISFTLENPGETELALYNLQGQLISTILGEYLPAGVYEEDVPVSLMHSLGSGMYFIELTVYCGQKTEKQTRKIVLLK